MLSAEVFTQSAKCKKRCQNLRSVENAWKIEIVENVWKIEIVQTVCVLV